MHMLECIRHRPHFLVLLLGVWVRIFLTLNSSRALEARKGIALCEWWPEEEGFEVMHLTYQQAQTKERYMSSPSAFLHFHILLSRQILLFDQYLQWRNLTPRTLSLLLFFPYCKLHTNLSAGHKRKPIR